MADLDTIEELIQNAKTMKGGNLRSLKKFYLDFFEKLQTQNV